ncbi:MAG: nicotinamide mononucleotide transporter [Sphingobacteriales bacterium]|nr:MAG: nicotinamide mononucleotide transporter [Sphingobacteriales bacterium]
MAGLSLLEIIGLLSGIVYVILAARAIIWCWPVGLVNVGAFLFINYEAKLYADTALQVVYLFLTLYGWYKWMEKPENKDNTLMITDTNKQQWIYIAIVFVVSTVFLSLITGRYTDTDVPVWDAVVTALSLIATWMVAHKKIENWLVWIVADILYIGLYYYKEYYLLVILFFIYIIVAIQGYFYWLKLKKVKPAF